MQIMHVLPLRQSNHEMEMRIHPLGNTADPTSVLSEPGKIHKLHVGSGSANCIAFAPHGGAVVAGSYDGHLRLINVGSGQILNNVDVGGSFDIV